MSYFLKYAEGNETIFANDKSKFNRKRSKHWSAQILGRLCRHVSGQRAELKFGFFCGADLPVWSKLGSQQQLKHLPAQTNQGSNRLGGT